MDPQLNLDLTGGEDLDQLWNRLLKALTRQIGRDAVQSWLEAVRMVELTADSFTLAVASGTAREWIQKRYCRLIETAAEAELGRRLEMRLVVRRPSRNESAEAAPLPAAPLRPQAVDPSFPTLPLHGDCLFDNFVVGDSNRVAAGAARAVAEAPARAFNPLFIYGGVGLGKTHLLHAIGNAVRQREPRVRLAYISGESFTTHFINSLRERRQDQFRRAHRTVDLWIVDDVQFIADKATTRQEFFHTFNDLFLANRQIIMAADRTPRELRLLEDRLRTRMESGLMVEVGAPDLETRISILRRKVELEGAAVPDEVIRQIACGITSSVRLLQGALIRVLALASLQHREIDAELTAHALEPYSGEGGIERLGQEAVLRAVCDFFQIEESDLTGPRRDRRTVVARQVAMHLVRELMGRSLVDIGQMFGGKSHSTVLYALGRLQQTMKEDGDLEQAVNTLLLRLKS